MTDAEYLARRKQYKRSAYARRKAAGQCVGCCTPICEQRSVAYCAVCLDKQSASGARHRQRQRALGLCRTCGKSSVKFIHCLPCRMAANAVRRARWALKRKDILQVVDST